MRKNLFKSSAVYDLEECVTYDADQRRDPAPTHMWSFRIRAATYVMVTSSVLVQGASVGALVERIRVWQRRSFTFCFSLSPYPWD